MDKQEEKNQQLVFFSYIDKETGKVLAQDQAAGETGDPIKYQPDKQLAALGQQGYELAYNGFPDGARFSENDQMNQVFAILMQHKKRVVNPDEAEQSDLAADEHYVHHYTLTTNFVDEHGAKVHPSKVQQSIWRCPFILDEVTKKAVGSADGQWLPETKQYASVKAPVVTGYLAEKSTLPDQPVAQRDLTNIIVYHPLGKIIPVSVDGQPILDGQSIQYRNDPDDASKVIAQKLPQVSGYTNNLQSMVPVDPLKDTRVLYEAVAGTNDQKVPESSTDKGEIHHYTVHFLNQEGKQLTADDVQDSVWHSDGSRNVKNYQDVDLPVIEGYYTIDHRLRGPVAVPFELNHTVIYRRLGKIIPIDENGEKISKADQPTYKNDPTDPTKPLADQPVPEVQGYVAELATITPDDGDMNTKVVYHRQ